MNHNIKGFTRTLAVIAGATLLIAACGGGSSSSGRTRNVALCYADQAEKDAAVSEAQAAFDASFGGNPPPSDDSVPDSSVPDSSVPDSSVPDTSVPAEETPDTLSSDGGGYRRPAVRHFATVPPTESADSVALTDEQLTLQLELQAAEEMQLCETSEGESAATCTATVTVEGVTDNCDPGDVLISDQGVWVLNDVNDAELARGEVDISALSADNPIVIEISYQIAGQESSDTTTPSETQTIECTGTISGTLDKLTFSSDCPNSFELLATTNNPNIILWGVWDENLEELSRGEIDLSALSADNPIVVQISYEIGSADEGDGESDEVTCSVSVDATNAIFECAKQIDALVHVTYNGGPSTQTFEGTGNTQFGISSGATAYSVYACEVGRLDDLEGSCWLNSDNVWTEGNDRTIEFTVPASLGDANLDSDADDADMVYTSTLNTELTRSVIVEVVEGGVVPHLIFTSDCNLWFGIELFDAANPWDEIDWWGSSDLSNSDCGIDFTLDRAPGTYELFIAYSDSETLSVLSNVEWESIDYADFKLPSLSFYYELPGSRKADYAFTITEPTVVSFTASAGETCGRNETGEEGNGFSDAELYLYKVEDNGYRDSVAEDDNLGHSPGNCSAAWLEIELEPGDYVLEAEDDDREGGIVTVNSSVELSLIPSNFPQTFSDITAPKSYTITVPAGGKQFVAIANSGNSDAVCTEQNELDQEDWVLPFVDPYLLLVNNQTGSHFRNSNGGEDEGFACLSSYLDKFLVEGTYTLYASTNAIARNRPDETGLAGLNYSFGMSDWAMEDAIVAADPIPDSVPAPAALPVDNIKVGSSADAPSVVIASTVESMECDQTCIETLFVTAGITDGTLTINAGAESVVIKKGQKKAEVPVGKNAQNISVQATSTSGETVNLSSGIAVVPAEVTAQLDAATNDDSGSSSDLSSKLPYALVLLVALLGIAAVLNERRKKSVTQN